MRLLHSSCSRSDKEPLCVVAVFAIDFDGSVWAVCFGIQSRGGLHWCGWGAGHGMAHRPSRTCRVFCACGLAWPLVSMAAFQICASAPASRSAMHALSVVRLMNVERGCVFDTKRCRVESTNIWCFAQSATRPLGDVWPQTISTNLQPIFAFCASHRRHVSDGWMLVQLGILDVMCSNLIWSHINGLGHAS